MPTPLYQVDAFTRHPFRGNPAAVALLDAPAEPGWMQAVANEMNLAETAFVVPPAAGVVGLRWFTPTVEVDLCGHATLAAAHALWETGRHPADRPIVFATRSGELTATRLPDRIELDFPATPAAPAAAPAGLQRLLGAAVQGVWQSRFDLLVELEDEAAVRRLAPDLDEVARLPVRGVIVTAAGRDTDFVSRFFAPQSGVPEDPVTGSAHCALAPFWAARIGRTSLVGAQLSPRGGTVHVRLDGDRCHLGGEAITVLRGELVA